MKIDTVRARLIQAYIDSHAEQLVKELHAPVKLGGENKYLQVWKVPISHLIYNIRNGRFRAELQALEKELKRTLDPTDKNDAKIIQKLLLDQNVSETEALKKDLKENSQIHPGIITFDGAVINGNRRMAVLSRLLEETSDPRFEYLKVGRLDQGVNERDLWRIEAGLQFANDFKLEYGPVNELLKLREGIETGLSPKQISHELMGRYSEKDVEERLRVLELIDTYLVNVGKPAEYHLFKQKRKVEQFISLQSNVISSLRTKGGYKPRQLQPLVDVGLSMIESGEVNYLDVRKIKAIEANPKAREALFAHFKSGNHTKAGLKKLIDGFRLAVEIVEDTKASERPEQLASKALSALESIDRNNPKLKDTSVRRILSKLAAQVDELLKASKAR